MIKKTNNSNNKTKKKRLTFYLFPYSSDSFPNLTLFKIAGYSPLEIN